MPASFLILPGINDSGPEHWQSRWERALPGARRVHQTDWDQPVCADWVSTLQRAVADGGPNIVLVAHSLGCLLIAHAAAGDALGPSVRGALLVAPPDPDAPSFPDVAKGFSPLPLTRLPFPSVVVASQDDPYASFEFSTRVAAAWGSRLVSAGACGHVNAASGLNDWPLGRKCLNDLVAGLPG